MDGSGSSIVVAIVLATILVTLGGAVGARSVGDAQAARGVEERSVARSLAEFALDEAIRVLGGPEQRRATIERRPLGPLRSEEAVGALEALHPAAQVTVDRRSGETPDERVIEVSVTVGDSTHVAQARVRPFLTADHLLLLEHRALDPLIQHVPRTSCTWRVGDPRRSTFCRDVDPDVGVPDGPVHLNDRAVLPEGLGDGPLTTFPHDGSRHRPEMSLPRTIGAVIGQSPVTCRFRGPTSIRLDGASIRVRSPRSVPRAGEVSGATEAIGCMGVDRSLLDGFVAIPLPADATIAVVRDEDEGCIAHPLGLSAAEDADRAWSCASGDAFVWGRYTGRRTVLAEDDVQLVWDVEPGDASAVAPLEKGDLLGLVAGDSIVLRRLVSGPVRRVAPLGRNLAIAGPGLPPFGPFPSDAPTAVATTWERPRIVAAMAALRGSVSIQNPLLGQQHAGPIQVVGSIAARFPGLFAWEQRTSSGALIGATGYPVELRYDQRLLEDAPPLMPVSDGGGVRIIHRDVG